MNFTLLLLVTSLAVIHVGTAANTNRVGESGEISFVESADDASDKIHDKIRTDMENYKRIKEMTLKNKISTSTTEKTVETSSTTQASATVVEKISTENETIKTSSEATETTVDTLPTTLEPEVEKSSTESKPSVDPSSTTTEAATEISSTTLRKIELEMGKPEMEEEEEIEDSPISFSDDGDGSTILPETVNSSRPLNLEDRFILNAPVMCKDGRVADNTGKCRKIV